MLTPKSRPLRPPPSPAFYYILRPSSPQRPRITYILSLSASVGSTSPGDFCPAHYQSSHCAQAPNLPKQSMHKLVLLVLLASLLVPAAASSDMNYTAPVFPAQEHMYAASNNMVHVVCNLCAARTWPCSCVMPAVSDPFPSLNNQCLQTQVPLSCIDPALLSYAPKHGGSHVSHGQTATDLTPVAEFNANHTRSQPSVGEKLQQINENGTRVQPETVLAYVHDIYAVGDRRPPTPPRASSLAHASPRSTRQVFLPGGYVCEFALCGKAFDHAYKLK